MTTEVITTPNTGVTAGPAPPMYGPALPTDNDLRELLTARTRADFDHEAAMRQCHRADDDYYRVYIDFLVTDDDSDLDREYACTEFAHRIADRTAAKSREAQDTFYAALALVRRAQGY